MDCGLSFYRRRRVGTIRIPAIGVKASSRDNGTNKRLPFAYRPTPISFLPLRRTCKLRPR